MSLVWLFIAVTLLLKVVLLLLLRDITVKTLFVAVNVPSIIAELDSVM